VGTLGQLGEKEATIGGIVTALRLLKTKKGDRMATFVLEDLEGGAEVLVFPEAYKKAAARLADDVIVLVKGRAEALDEGRFRLLASDVMPLETAKLSEARYVTIRVPVGSWDKTKGERLRDILGSHKGDCPVTLEMVRRAEALASRWLPAPISGCGRTRSCARRSRDCSARDRSSSPAPAAPQRRIARTHA
jgi:DNA polymerase III alpha subunit